MKSKFFVVVLAFVFALSSLGATYTHASSSYFADANLETAVKDSLDVDTLTEESFAEFFELNATDYGITSLQGLETRGTNLEYVSLDNNKIKDVSPLQKLTNIGFLDLSFNAIENIKPLVGLSETFLFLSYNNISDLSAFKGKKSVLLDLSGNNITDLSPLKDVKEGFIDISENPLNEASLALIKELENQDGLTIFHDGSKFVDRLSGKSRFETAVAISESIWFEADTVVIANGLNFPDALAGGPLAYSLNAPILLTRPDSLHAATKDEILRLGAKNVVILGGEAAISKKVENQLKALSKNMSVKRIAGADRYETAKKIADEMGTKHEEVVVVSGRNFPDALSIAPYAAMNNLPILLVAPDKVPASTKTVLKNASNTLVIGGYAAVGKSLEKQFKNPYRISGANRYETAALVMEELEMDPTYVYVANGRGFADALTGSVLAGMFESPLLLVNPDEAPEATMDVVEAYNINNFTILGGEASVPEFVVEQLLR